MFGYVAIAAGVLVAACAISLIVVAPSVWRASREGRTALEEGAAAVLRRDAGAARIEFSAARGLFRAAGERLRSPFAWPLRIVPVASTHVDVARSLSTIGTDISDAGLGVAAAMRSLPDGVLTLDRGRVDMVAARKALEALRIAVRPLPAIEDAIAGMPTGWVGGPLSTPRDQARDLLPSLVDGVRKAEAALAGLPHVLAEGGTKRYLVAFSNLSELRGSGGLFGYVTALDAADGDLDLGDLSGRPTELFPAPGEVGLSYPDWFPQDFRTQAEIFQNINMTTDFPTVGSFVLRTAETKLPLDGVIAVDPVGIGAVLNLTGPIRIPTWSGQITSENVAQIAMHDVYVSIPDRRRRDVFFEQLVRTAFDQLVTTKVRFEPATIGAFDTAVRGGHFRMFSEHSGDQRLFDRLGISGATSRARGADDVLSVVSENATGNKADWFLRRDIRYDVRLDPESGIATTNLDVTFRNTAPRSGLPDDVIGSPVSGLEPGENRQIVMLVRSKDDNLERVTIDGRDAALVSEREGILRGYRSTIEIGARSSSDLQASSLVRFSEHGGRRSYRLHVLRQAVARPDFAEIEIHIPAGWKVTGQRRFLGDLTTDVTLEVTLERTVRGALVQKLLIEPYRLARRLVDRLI